MAVHKIIMQDLSTMAEPVEIVSGDFLNFSKNHLITGVNVIEDLLFWTDNYNQPRKININKAINDPAYYDSEDKVSVAKPAPYVAPLVYEHQNLQVVTTTNTLQNDTNVASDYLKENFVRFSYRYKYEDNEYSLIAPFTQTVFEPLNEGCIVADGAVAAIHSGNVGTGNNKSNYQFGSKKIVDTGRVAVMQNAINRVKLRIPLPHNNDALTASYSLPLTNGEASFEDTDIVFTSGAAITAGHYILKGNFTSTTVAANASTNDLTQFVPASNTSTNPTISLDKGEIKGPIAGKVAFVPMWENTVGIKSIEILIKESDDAAVRVVGEVSVRDIRDFYDNVDVYPMKSYTNMPTYWRYCYVFDYKSEQPYKVIPENQVNRVSDDIPIVAQAQEVVSNRIVYGNYLKNYQYPTDAAGNKGINYNVELTAKGVNEYNATGSVPNHYFDLRHNEFAYRYLSLKQRRTYQVGIVLSDRYGRQSPVILSSAKKGNEVSAYNNSPDTITTINEVGNGGVGYSAGPGGGANFSWSTVEDDVVGNSLSIEFKDTFLVPADQAYHATNNKLGWYSYRVVVKQPEQDYYNVYTPNAAAATDSVAASSYITLFSDNINKVPRSILEQDVNRDNISGSDVFLFPKVLATGTSKLSILQAVDGSTLIDVISLGTISQQDSKYDYASATASLLSPGTNQSVVYKDTRGPLIAEINNLKVLYGGYEWTNNDHLVALNVFETEPFKSKIDVYYETSTAGLVTDLNWSLQLVPPASAPEESSIEFTGGALSASLREDKTSSNASIPTVIATPGTGGHTLVYELLNLWSYNATGKTDFKNRLTMTSAGALSLNSGFGFAHRNSDYDKYDLVVKVSEYAGKDYVGSSIRALQLNITNHSPNLFLYASNGSTDGDGIITADINFYERFNVTVDNGYTNTGFFDNGGTDNVEKVHGMTFAVTFPNITDTALRAYAEKAFKVEPLVGGKFDVKTTWAYEFYDNFDKEPLNIDGAGGLTKQKFFALEDNERKMTITGTDNAASPLTDTVIVQINEALATAKMSEIRLLRISNASIFNAFESDDGLNKVRVAHLARGSVITALNALSPQVGNIIYANKKATEKYAGDSSRHLDVTKDLWISYNYTKLGYNGKSAKYSYVVLDKTTSAVKKVGILIVPVGTQARDTISAYIDNENLSA
jgi:hypothetical protein